MNWRFTQLLFLCHYYYYNSVLLILLQDINKNVRSILNKITPDNMIVLTKKFKALPIDTIERLEKTIDLVFEKV